MAKTREQFMVGIIHIDDLHPEGNEYVFEEKHFDIIMSKSRKVLVSENRMFRFFSHTTEMKHTLRRGEDGRVVRDEEGAKLYDEQEVRSAKEFTVLNLSNPKEKAHAITTVLAKGYIYRYKDGREERQQRVVRSASMVRVDKAFFTSLDPSEVREAIGFGADFGKEVIIAQMEARYGQATSSTIEITNEHYSFDVMPDYSITRKHDVRVWDDKNKKLKTIKDFENDYEPLDGQGTILPSAAVRTAHSLQLISRKDRTYLLDWLTVYNEDIRLAWEEDNKDFIKLWSKIPSSFQVRFGFAKGLLIVFPHNLQKYRQDCNGKKYCTKSKAMPLWKDKGDIKTVNGEERHYYNFDSDIMFTDSQWKANPNPKYLMDAESDVPMERRMHLEIVLWQKNRLNPTVFMGYQYWQALPGINAKKYAGQRIKELKDTIFTDWKETLLFLGMYDTGNSVDEYDEKMDNAAGKIQKVIMLLNENPELLQERWVQDVIRDTRDKYINDMATGRISVKGANPYIATCPELQFGQQPTLQAGEHYYNGVVGEYAGFRSPLIHKSEAVVIKTVENDYYTGLFQDMLIFNPFDDSLPRMGGADTDGDKIALVDDANIVAHVETGLPMLYDEGKKGEAVANTRAQIWNYDKTTILASIMSIGEITNMATTWKDIATMPKLMERMGLNEQLIDNNVSILRFSQGTSIDFAKTGFFFQPPKYALTMKSPHWKPWSQRMAQFGFKGAEVYESSSQLGQLFNAVKKYMAEKYKEEIKDSTRDFTFEFTDNVDYAEMIAIKPIIAEMEQNYRNELRTLHDMQLDEDQEREYITAIMDKYQYAVMSIDADIRSIAAASYIHSYYESSSKSAKISFPWVTCFEGLLLNVAETSTRKVKMRKVRFDGHIDDVPEQIKVYRNEAKGEDFTVFVKAPNGTYETHKRNGQVYIVMASKSQAKAVEKAMSTPVDKAVLFQINSFSHNDSSASEIVELLKANSGIVRIQKVKDRGQAVNSLHAGVWIGNKRVANVNRQQKHTLIPYLQKGAVEFKVQDFENLSATYVAKRTGDVKEHKFLTLNFIMEEMIEAQVLTPSEDNNQEYVAYDGQDTGVPYYGEDTGVPYYEEPQHEAPVIELDDEESIYYTFEGEAFEKLSKRASYWNVDVDSADFGIVGASVETIGSEYEVSLIRQDGAKAVFTVAKNRESKQFEITSRRPNEKLTALVLQVAHFELYKEYLAQKQA